ncbi:MAG: hypothetical protein QME58_00995 [Bacteroidota bacterium]|nr:hypothetical protein [Bacteroidota bacterium]
MRRYLLNMTNIVLIFVALGYPQINFARTHLLDSSRIDYSAFESMITLFPPFLLKNSGELKSFIRDDEFVNFRKQNGDLAAVDLIYQKAKELTRGNTGISLLICSIATLDHYTLGIKIPLINLYIPLTSENKEDFQMRTANLPTHFYSNSPSYPYGDRDKLQHIFGSAFLIYVFESEGLAERYSSFVEKIEDRYIKDGNYDERDMEANKDGQRFGLLLMKNKNAKPSDILYTVVP